MTAQTSKTSAPTRHPPAHHPEEEMLLAYATGTLPEAMAFVVRVHAHLCNQCSEEIRLYEQAGGLLLLEGEEMPVSSDLKSRVLGLLDAEEDRPDTSAMPARSAQTALAEGDLLVPGPLQAIVHKAGFKDLDGLNWRRLGGYAEADLPLGDALTKTRLLRLAPGAAMPQHTHEGTELTLVLHGAFSDETGLYRAGDLVATDSTVRHTPKATQEAPCLCLAVTDAPLKLTGPIGRMLNPFVAL